MNTIKRAFLAGMLILVPFTCPAQLLWRVSRSDLPGDSFVFGTNHIVEVEFCDSVSGFGRVLSNVEQVYFETVLSDSPVAESRYSIFMPAGQSLNALYEEREMSLILDYIADITGVQYTIVNFTPSGLQRFVLERVINMAFPGRDLMEKEGMDLSLQKRVVAMGLPLRGFETLDYQMQLLYGKSLEEQAADLLEWIQSPASRPDSLVSNQRSLFAAYKEEDIAAIEKLLFREQLTPFSRELLVVRNNNWLPIMIEAMKSKSTLFAVGAGHLVGDSGLVALLRKNGYTVTPVQ